MGVLITTALWAIVLVPTIIVLCIVAYRGILEIAHNLIIKRKDSYYLLSHYSETGCKQASREIVKRFDNILSLSVSNEYCCIGKGTVIDFTDYIIMDGAYAKIKVAVKKDEEGKIEIVKIDNIEMK